MSSPTSEPRQTEAAVQIKTSDGYLQVPEGSIYWKFDEKQDGDVNERPTILLIHSALADHTMWNDQVEFLVSKDWNCLRPDLFGYGKSGPSEEYLRNPDRNPFDSVEQIDQLRQTVLGPDSSVIVVGLSVGASLALAYTIARPEHVSGLCLTAGGLRGFEHPNDPREDELFDHADQLSNIGDHHGFANMMVRIWGDGPLQDPGRLPDHLVDRMLRWNVDISSREYSKTGGTALDAVRRDPPAVARLHTIAIPTAVAWGVFDETYTTASMKYVAGQVKEAIYKEFNTAHMVNLEKPDEYNQWLSDWLEAYFDS